MNYTNRMVSSDNMGYASYLMEQEKNPGELPGKVKPRHQHTTDQKHLRYHKDTINRVCVCVLYQGGFVAGFSSSNLGDVSPNTKGPHCVNSGLPCDYLNSSCPVGGVTTSTSIILTVKSSHNPFTAKMLQ